MFKLNFHLTKATLLYAKKNFLSRKKNHRKKWAFQSVQFSKPDSLGSNENFWKWRLAACEWKISRSMPVSFGQYTPNCNNVVIRKWKKRIKKRTYGDLVWRSRTDISYSCQSCYLLSATRLDFEFKFHFLTKIEIKKTYLVFFLFFTVSSPLKPFGGCFIDVYNLELYRTVRELLLQLKIAIASYLYW